MELSSSQHVHHVRARALTNEFTWDEWTELRHAYLCARHQARFHPDEWSSRHSVLPPAFRNLFGSINEVVPQEVRETIHKVGPLPELEDIHTFLDAEIGRLLLGFAAQPARELRDAWESGEFPLLILRLLEIEIDRRMGWDSNEPKTQRVSEASTSYGFEHWIPVDSFEVQVEGLLEDVAYHRIAHDDNAVVTIESLDGTYCYFAASKGLVIGEDPIALPAQGDSVRLRTWKRGLISTIDLAAGSIDVVEDLVANKIAAEFPRMDALVRFVLLVNGGEEAPLTWVRWTADDLIERTGLIPEDDEHLDDDSDVLEESAKANTDFFEVLKILRVDQPKWVSDRKRDRSYDHALLGEQSEWAYALPWMYRIISADHPGAMMPRCPGPKDSVFSGPCGYWAALWELLRFNLGWSQLARGLDWWLSAGRPVEDRKLRLLRDIWLADGQLDWFRAWLYERESSHSERPPAQWFDQIEANIREEGVRTNPFTGGSDPLHLQSHGEGPLKKISSDVQMSATYIGDGTEAIVLLPGLGGWYAALSERNPSVRVRVMVPWIGEIGLFSCSQRTGLWHSTTEDIHLAGNFN